MSPATAGDTAGSSMRRTASRPICCSTCRSTIRSRSRASRCATRRAAPRHLSVTAYVEWVLGPSRAASAPFVTTEIDPDTGAMFARNPWNPAFGSRVAFADLGGRQTDWTGDRREFIGRNGTLASPAALAGAAPLSNTRRRRSRSLRRAADHGRAAAERQRRDRLLPRRGRERRRGAQPDRALPRGRSRRRAVARSTGTGTTSSARSR